MEWSKEQFAEIDPHDMYGKIVDFPAQLQDGFKLPVVAGKSQIDTARIKSIVIAGMGGSAIGGDMLRAYLADQLPLPIYINRNYGLPKFVDRSTLVIGSSYSGNTEETLAAFAEAQARGCQLFVSTTGGKLGTIAEKAGIHRVTLPTGYQPRAALGYSFGPLLHFVEQIGLIPAQGKLVTSACEYLADNLRQYLVESPNAKNQAKQIAELLFDKIAVIYAGADYYDTNAIRFKGQICENAKHLAYANICPEFNHNELVGFEFPKELLSKLVVIFLTGPGDHKRVGHRFEIVESIVKDQNIKTVWVKAGGPSRLAEIFSLVQVGDFVSFYLAMSNKVDPSPVKVIDRLKGELERKG
ncbi:MAG: bifunctional phosphoglucose/phosphomannose isomerase [bacterium]